MSVPLKPQSANGIVIEDGRGNPLATWTGSRLSWSGSQQIGDASTDLVGFHGATPTDQCAAYTQTHDTANRTVAAATQEALTDSTTGTASNTLAAGAGVMTLTIPHTIEAGTSAGEVITAYTLGYKFKVLAWSFTTDVPGVGSSASRVFNMEIGTTDVGSTPSTLTLTEASTSAKGEQTAGTTVTGANTGSSSDTFSIEVAAGGTAFTAGSGVFTVKVQNMDTADAFASLVDEHTKGVADDLDNRSTLTAIIDDLQEKGLVG